METNRLIAVIVRLVHGFIPDFTQRLLKGLLIYHLNIHLLQKLIRVEQK